MAAAEHREPARARWRATLVGLIVTCAAVALVLLSVALYRARQDTAAARADAATARAEAQAARSAAALSEAAAAGLQRQLGARARSDDGENGWGRTIPIPLAPMPGVAPPRRAVAPAPAGLRGFVKQVRNINGVHYAEISLGAADQLTKGMRFKVRDRDVVLAELTVDTVDAGESVGHLEGPGVERVRLGSEVRAR